MKETDAARAEQTLLLESLVATGRHCPGTKRDIVKLLKMFSIVAKFWKVIYICR